MFFWIFYFSFFQSKQKEGAKIPSSHMITLAQLYLRKLDKILDLFIIYLGRLFFRCCWFLNELKESKDYNKANEH